MTAISPLAPARRGPNLLLRPKYRTRRNEFLVNDFRRHSGAGRGPSPEPTNADAAERIPPALGKTVFMGSGLSAARSPGMTGACVRFTAGGANSCRCSARRPAASSARRARSPSPACPASRARAAAGRGTAALRPRRTRAWSRTGARGRDAQRPAARLVPEEALASDLHAVHAVLVAAGGDAVGAPEALIGLRRRIRPGLRLSRQSKGDANSDKNQRASWHRVHLPGRPSAERMLAHRVSGVE